MKVVSNTSPILNLELVGELSLLKRLFDEVVVPDAVRRELEVRLLEADSTPAPAIPSWVQHRPAANRPFVES